MKTIRQIQILDEVDYDTKKRMHWLTFRFDTGNIKGFNLIQYKSKISKKLAKELEELLNYKPSTKEMEILHAKLIIK